MNDSRSSARNLDRAEPDQRRDLLEARKAIASRTPALPDPGDTHISDLLARQVDGKTAAQICDKLGEENFAIRHIEKTRPADRSAAKQTAWPAS